MLLNLPVWSAVIDPTDGGISPLTGLSFNQTADFCGGVGLSTFTFDASQLCAPADDEFTAWLDGIFTASGSRCAAVPVLPGLAHVLMSMLLAGLGAVGIRRRRGV